jgi:hypothetical protein
MKLRTECGHEIWVGFFGKNANGDQDECMAEFEVDVDEDEIESDCSGIRPAFTVQCPKCGSDLAWPQIWWEVIK